jgi:DNA-binding CsgD family transcriptional regulator
MGIRNDKEYPLNLVYDILDLKNDEEFECVADLDSCLAYVLACLSDRGREVIELMYKNNYTLKETAEVMGITMERVYQLEAKAIIKMKNKKYQKLLKYGLDGYINMEMQTRVNMVTEYKVKAMKEKLSKSFSELLDTISVEEITTATNIQNAEIPEQECQDLQLEEIGLTKNLVNIFKRRCINTVNEVLELEPTAVQGFRGMGKVNYRILVEKLANIGIDTTYWQKYCK